jgi:hypothetical protein
VRPRRRTDSSGRRRLSSNSVHRTVAGATHQSLIDDKSDAVQSSRAIGDVVTAVQKKRG